MRPEKLLCSCSGFSLVWKIGMHMLRNALDRYLRMLAKEIERVGRRARIELLVNELRLLLCSLLIHIHAAVDDRQVVVRGQIIRVDLL